MPQAERAVVDLTKLRDYCLSATHPRGRHKARVFEATLGFTSAHAEELRSALLVAVRGTNAERTEQDSYGQRYVVDATVHGPAGQAMVRSIWIIREGEDFPRLITCYVL